MYTSYTVAIKRVAQCNPECQVLLVSHVFIPKILGGIIMKAKVQSFGRFLSGMVMGPLAGLVIKKFDAAVDGRIKPGFEMLINNFSVGILGMVMAILGFYLIGPVMGIILSFLTAGVQILLQAGIFPLISVFVEPAKVLFLNNAINHGIFTPLGAEQVAETGNSSI